LVRLSDIKLSIDKAPDAYTERCSLRDQIIARLRTGIHELSGFEIYRKSVDARKKDKIYYVYTVDAKIRNEKRFFDRSISNNIICTPEMSYAAPVPGTETMRDRPVIAGMGPAGLFAGLILSAAGYRPVMLERGEDAETRKIKVEKFRQSGILDADSNIQFGEGGAGTFSDGKLTTLINDDRCRIVLKELIKAGAPQEIMYQSKPHIGTDMLMTIVGNIRKRIIAYGGEVRFNAKVTDLVISNGNIDAVIINDNETIPCCVAVLAIGHSARDTFEMLLDRNIKMEQKAFSIGLRIEHPQELIDKAQYGGFAGYPGLGAADYKLAYHSANGRSAYTFCMCPGGYVIGASSEDGGVVTNGMSEYARNGENANSALLVGVTPADFTGSHPLAGIEFQRKWERSAYRLAGSDHKAPIQLTGDFLKDVQSSRLGGVKPTYMPGTAFARLSGCLPGYAADTLKEAIIYFDKLIKGFAMPDSVLTGVETRSSSPVRMIRDKEHLSDIGGIYPAGEGAGYSGGIMSSCVDGIKTAEKIISRYEPFN
jgi:uncharacterized protein